MAIRPPAEVHVSFPVPPSSVTNSGDSPGGLSPWSARVLDQLSLTAWLPAGLLVANAYLLAGMYMVRKRHPRPTMQNLGDAVSALNEKPVGVIISVLAGLVLAALITQSFEFAAIRFLEGYWGGSILAAAPTWAGIRLQRTRRSIAIRRAAIVARRAFKATEDRVVKELQSTPELANAVRLIGSGKPVGNIEHAMVLAAEGYYLRQDWMVWAPAHLRHRAGTLAIRLEAYPSRPSRMMPTRLGNTMRSAEDQLKGHVAGARMRGYLYAHLDSIDPALMRQHTQYRNRLDMFSVMTVLTAALIPVNSWFLRAVLPTSAILVVTLGLLLISLFSYRGAISAALDYGAILLAIDAGIVAAIKERAGGG